jgi:uncharacterized protein YbdZ (MbtH family)
MFENGSNNLQLEQYICLDIYLEMHWCDLMPSIMRPFAWAYI